MEAYSKNEPKGRLDRSEISKYWLELKRFVRTRAKIISLILIQAFFVALFFHFQNSKPFQIKGDVFVPSNFWYSGGILERGNQSLSTVVPRTRKENGAVDNAPNQTDSGFDSVKAEDVFESIEGASSGGREKKGDTAKTLSDPILSSGSKEIENEEEEDKWGGKKKREFLKKWKQTHPWPPKNALSVELERLNSLPPRNRNLFPDLSPNRIVVVLYVHNRPNHLKVVLESLSKVVGINETLLIVSHDGKFEAMDALVQGVRFCQVKQIYALYSPHNFNNTFPKVSPGDCVGNKDKLMEERKANANNGSESGMPCAGQHDAYNNYRDPHYVSLKHHWWWMMNTVWDGLEETHGYQGNILFIEEDYYIFPNAYAHLQLLLKHKDRVCPHCIAVNLGPSRDYSLGENFHSFVSERMGNLGYSFNRTIWNDIHSLADKFCTLDDYNWDWTFRQNLEFYFTNYLSLRWSRASIFEIGKCGLHKNDCDGDGLGLPQLEPRDYVVNINENSGLREVYFERILPNFKGFGGWADWRDQELCRFFSFMHRN